MSRPTVFIIESNDTLAKNYVEEIASWGFAVHRLSDLQEAQINLGMTDHCSLVLCDLEVGIEKIEAFLSWVQSAYVDTTPVQIIIHHENLPQPNPFERYRGFAQLLHRITDVTQLDHIKRSLGVPLT